MKHIKEFKTFEHIVYNENEVFGNDEVSGMRDIENNVSALYNSVITGIKSGFSKLFRRKPKNEPINIPNEPVLPNKATENEQNYIDYLNDNFNRLNWTDSRKAKEYLKMTQSCIDSQGSAEQLKSYCQKINNLIER